MSDHGGAAFLIVVGPIILLWWAVVIRGCWNVITKGRLLD